MENFRKVGGGLVDPSAIVPRDCVLEPNSYIIGKIRLGRRVWVSTNATIKGPGRIGDDTYIGSGSYLGFPTASELESLRKKTQPPDRGEIWVGRKVVIRTNCILYSHVKVGSEVKFGHNVMLREGTVVGDGCTVGTGSIIDGGCRIGSGVSIQTGVYIPPGSEIADKAFLGPCCVLLNDKYMKQTPYPLRGPKIGRGASIGANATIMPDVTVGEGAVVGAGAVVTRDVAPQVVVGGVPARVIKKTPKEWGIK